MVQNIQQYLNNLVNKSRSFYLDISNHSTSQTCQHCNQRTRNCNKILEGEITDLSQFTNLKSLNASNNGFNNLNFLDTLPNKDKLEKLNLFNNQISDIDFAKLFTDFPNLKAINLDNNPLKANNLASLSTQQLTKLVEAIVNKEIRLSSYKGTFLMDLLKHIKANSNLNQTTALHLQHFVQSKASQKEVLANFKSENTKEISASPNSNTAIYLIGGLILLISSVLALGYYLGKKNNDKRAWK